MDKLNDILKKNKVLIIIFAIISIIHVLYAALSQRAAYMDGAQYTLRLLNYFSNGKFQIAYDPTHPRFFITAINQMPMIISYFVLGIKSKYWLSVIYNIPLFLFPILALVWNWKLTQRTNRYDIFVLSVLLYSIIILPYSMFSVVETMLGSILYFILFNYIAGNIDYTKKDLALIGCLLITLFGTYEDMIFIGPMLFIASLYYAKNEKNILNKKVKYIAGAISLIAGLYILSWFFKTNTQVESMRFLKDSVWYFEQLTHLNLSITAVAALAIPLLIFKKECFSKKNIALITVIFGYLLLRLFNDLPHALAPVFEIQFRTVPCWSVPLMFFIILISDYFKKIPSKNFYTNLLTVVLIAGIAHTIWQINHTYWWNKNIDYMMTELKNLKGRLYIPEEHEEIASFYNKDYRRYVWNYTTGVISILFAPEKEIKALVIQPINHIAKDPETNGNLTFAERCFVNSNTHFTIPDIKLKIKNEFWDATKVTDALNEYNKKHGLITKEMKYKTNPKETPTMRNLRILKQAKLNKTKKY